MDHFKLIIILSIYSVLTNAQIDSDSSITKASWFWPLLAICLALLISIPCTIIIIIIICHNKHKLTDDSDESSINSSSSSSTIPVRHETRHRHSRQPPSYHVNSVRSPPPPYTTCEQPQNIFVSPSLPPPYESHHINENVPTTTAEPLTTTNTQSTETLENPPAPPPPPLDISSSLTSPSIQTFQA